MYYVDGLRYIYCNETLKRALVDMVLRDEEDHPPAMISNFIYQ